MSHIGRNRITNLALVGAFLGLGGSGLLAPSSFRSSWAQAKQAQPLDSAKVIEDFLKRVNEYVVLHKKIEDSLPKLSKESTPKQVTDNQRKFAAILSAQRSTAKRGDLFTPEMTILVKRLLQRVFSGPEGKQLRSSIMDENPVGVKLTVNGRYPDNVPMSTMPPEVLKGLPELPEELQFRFVGEQLILLDPHAHIIPDYIIDALPGG